MIPMVDETKSTGTQWMKSPVLAGITGGILLTIVLHLANWGWHRLMEYNWRLSGMYADSSVALMSHAVFPCINTGHSSGKKTRDHTTLHASGYPPDCSTGYLYYHRDIISEMKTISSEKGYSRSTGKRQKPWPQPQR